MRRQALPLVCLAALCVTACLRAQVIGPAKPKRIYPLEVELKHGLKASDLHAGDDVPARLRQDWTDGTCTVARGAVVHGRVMAASDHELGLLFQYGCAAAAPQKLTWIALLAPEGNDLLDSHGNPVTTQALRSSSFGEGDPLRPSGTKSGADMSGRQNPALPIFADTHANDGRGQRPTAVKTGEVWHLPKLAMRVGAGPEGSTVLSSTEKQVKVPGHAVLILLPEQAALRSVAASPAHVEKASTTAPARLQ